MAGEIMGNFGTPKIVSQYQPDLTTLKGYVFFKGSDAKNFNDLTNHSYYEYTFDKTTGYYNVLPKHNFSVEAISLDNYYAVSPYVGGGKRTKRRRTNRMRRSRKSRKQRRKTRKH
jgi:hypothetical protein